jgi:hypothetical protein
MEKSELMRIFHNLRITYTDTKKKYNEAVAINNVDSQILTSLDLLLLATPTNNVLNDLQTARGIIKTSLGATLQADLNEVNNLIVPTSLGLNYTIKQAIEYITSILSGTSTDSLMNQIKDSTNSILNGINGGTSGNVKSAVNYQTSRIRSIGTILSQSIDSIITLSGNDQGDIYTNLYKTSLLFDCVKSVSGFTNGTINSTFSSSGSHTFDMMINAVVVPFMVTVPTDLGNGTVGTRPILIDDEIIATGQNDEIITFINKGSIITSVTDIINYFNNYYPIGTIITTNIYQKIQDTRSLLGGNAPGLMNRISTLSSTILNTPTGNVTRDLGTIKTTIGGGDSTFEHIIGNPTVNGLSSENLFSMIGGDENNLAGRIGDIATGSTTGLAGKFDKNSLSLPTVFDSNTRSTFSYGNDINTAMINFLSLFDKSKFDRSSDTKIVIDCSDGPPSSFSELLNRITTTT